MKRDTYCVGLCFLSLVTSFCAAMILVFEAPITFLFMIPIVASLGTNGAFDRKSTLRLIISMVASAVALMASLALEANRCNMSFSRLVHWAADFGAFFFWGVIFGFVGYCCEGVLYELLKSILERNSKNHCIYKITLILFSSSFIVFSFVLGL